MVRMSSSGGRSVTTSATERSRSSPGSVRVISKMSVIALRTVSGVIPCSSLYSSWIWRRRVVSSMARCIEPVGSSAYMMTRPDTLRAARPIVWMRERSSRRKPSLSASRMATSETSGRSSPSRSRLIPTSTSNVPVRSPRNRSMRSSVSTSECM